MAEPRWASRIVAESDVDPRTLVPNPENFRRHPKAQQAAMTGALDEIGWIQRVIVNRITGHIVDGHLRVEMALTSKEKSVPVCYVELSEEEERLALATFDPISAMAITDQRMFDSLVQSIGEDNSLLASILAKGDSDDAASGVGTASTASKLGGMEFRIVVDCENEAQQTELLARFGEEGLPCRALIS